MTHSSVNLLGDALQSGLPLPAPLHPPRGVGRPPHAALPQRMQSLLGARPSEGPRARASASPRRGALPVPLSDGGGRHRAAAVAERRDHLLELALADDDLDAHRAADLLPGQDAAAVVQLLEGLRRRLGLLPGLPGEEAPGRHVLPGRVSSPVRLAAMYPVPTPARLDLPW
jgi:hypothetical protein